MNKKFLDYQEELITSLKDPNEARAYLEAQDGGYDPELTCDFFKNILTAQQEVQAGNLAPYVFTK